MTRPLGADPPFLEGLRCALAKNEKKAKKH